jgi:hypothetical protein
LILNEDAFASTKWGWLLEPFIKHERLLLHKHNSTKKLIKLSCFWSIVKLSQLLVYILAYINCTKCWASLFHFHTCVKALWLCPPPIPHTCSPQPSSRSSSYSLIVPFLLSCLFELPCTFLDGLQEKTCNICLH